MSDQFKLFQPRMVDTKCPLPESIAHAAEMHDFAESTRRLARQLFDARRESQRRETDQLFAALLIVQWILTVAATLWLFPSVREGSDANPHQYLFVAVTGGALLAGIPTLLAMLLPGSALTRYSVTTAQMLLCGLLVHLTDGRIESHFYFFAGLALLTLYRDWKVIVLAAVVGAMAHISSDALWPTSLESIESRHWMSLEHIAWMLLMATVLALICRHCVREMYAVAERCAALEMSHCYIESTLCERTERLRTEETRINQVIDSAMDAVIAIRSDRLVTIWNQQAERIFGWSRAEALGRPLDDLIIPEPFRDGFRCGVKRFTHSAGATVLNRRIEVVGRHRDGHEFPIELSISTIGRGNEMAFCAFVRDISDRRRIQETLAERARLADLVADVGVALVHSRDTRVMLQRCADSMVKRLDALSVRIWTYNESSAVLELQARSGCVSPLGADARLELGQSTVGQVAQDRKPYVVNSMETINHILADEELTLPAANSFAAYPLLLEGRLVGALALYAKEPIASTTERELITIADSIALGIVRLRAERQLRQAHLENKQLLESISSILITLDITGTVTQWNRAAEAIFGVTAEQAIGRQIGDCGVEWTELHTLDSQIALGMTSLQTPVRCELVFLDQNGSSRFLDLVISRIEHEGTAEMGLLLLATDVTDQKQLQAQVAQSQKLESIGQLAAGIAHEINTPIQYVGDNVQFLQAAFGELEALLLSYEQLYQSAHDGPIEPAMLSDIEVARQRTDIEYLNHHIPKAVSNSLEGLNRVASIVRAMKEFSHPGSDDKVVTDINRAIESTVTVTRNEWKYVAEMELDLDPDLPGVPCLPGEFNQVLVNLIVNAAHAIADAQSTKRNEKGKIAISTRHDNDCMVLRISDTGSGIPPEIQHRIFDPFFTTKPVGRGTGQGLSLARHIIVTQHGGAIDFESEVGAGTTFIIRLPMQHATGNSGEPVDESQHCLC